MKMSREEYYDEYFNWLCETIKEPERKRYTTLLTLLHDLNFLYILERDSDRYEDGVYIRREYLGSLDDSGIPCSVLEMLVALALRMDRELIGESREDDPGPIFWEMVDNLGLKRFTDGRFNFEKVDRIMYTWLTRGFERNGKGSIFPLEKTRYDQRKKEIWGQMHEYLSKKHSK